MRLVSACFIARLLCPGALAAVLAGALVAPPATASTAAPGAPTSGATLLAPSWALAPETNLEALASAPGGSSSDPYAGGWQAAEQAADPAAAGGGGTASTPSPGIAALKSLVLPGWGQLSTGHKTQAVIFFSLEAATWASFVTFKNQESMRRSSSFETAQIYAGVDLNTKDESYRRLVGLYQSQEIYNQYVVMRDAAYFIDDPAEREAYIAENSIPAEEGWFWESRAAFDRYGEQRESAEEAELSGRFALGAAIVSRVVSSIMALRQATDLRKEAAHAAVPGKPVGRLVWDVLPGPGLATESRLAWVVTF